MAGRDRHPRAGYEPWNELLVDPPTAPGASAAGPGSPDPATDEAARRVRGDTASRLALNAMGTFDWDLDRGTFDLDASGLDVLGFRPGEFDGAAASLRLRVPLEESYRIEVAVSEAIREGGSSYGAYFRIQRRDGSRRWTHTQGRILRDAAGHPYRVLGIVRDATAELRHSPIVRTLEEDRRRQTIMVQRTTEALSKAVTTRDVARVLTETGSLERFGAKGLVLGLVQGDRVQVVALTGGPVEAVEHLENSRLDDDLPLSRAALTGRPRFVGSKEELLRLFPKLTSFLEPLGVNSAVFLPLVAQARPLGALGLLYGEQQTFSAEDRNLYLAIASTVAQSVQRALLFDQEREFATGLQATMLPRSVPPTPGGEVAVRYRAAGSGRDVGGDWYDVIALPQGRIGAVVGDVQGHDTHAAAVMGQLRIALRAYAAEGHAPATVLARASRFLAELDTERFATCTYVQADLVSGVAHVVRAGHLGPLLSDGRGSVVWPIVRGGLPLGLATELEQHDFPEVQLHLDPGATLVLCTDGLVEQPGDDIHQGIESLTRAVREGPHDAQPLADHLSELLRDRPRAEDDMALLVLRRDRAAAAPTLPRFHQHIHQADREGLADARAMVRHGLDAWHIGHVAGDIELIADELVTNALMHTDGGALLGLELLPGHPRRIRLEVQDRSSVWPRIRTPGEAATSGRGLLMVERLADRWGVEPRGPGKAVWCEFRLREGAGEPADER